MKTRYHLFYFILPVIVGLPVKSYGIASDDDTITPYIATNMLYDSNLLRVSDSTSSQGLGGKKDKSDIVNQIMAGFDMDWKISNQHVIIKANANKNWFQNFTNLDYTGWNTLAQWNWQLGNNFNGEIGYSNVEALGSFSFLNGLESNLQNNQRYFANGGWLFHPNGKVKVGIYRNQLEFEAASRQFNNNTEDTAEFHLQYLSPTGSTLGFQFLATDGKYPNLEFTGGNLDNAYMRFNYGATWEWHYSSKTQLYGFLGYTKQTYQNVTERDFDGFIGRLGSHWQPRESVTLDLVALREIRQAQNLQANFLLTQGLESSVTWQPSSKISLKVLSSYQWQEYLGNVSATQVGSPQQKDDVGIVGLDLLYNPIPNISIDTVFNFEKRDSSDPRRSYESQSVGVNLKAAF